MAHHRLLAGFVFGFVLLGCANNSDVLSKPAEEISLENSADASNRSSDNASDGALGEADEDVKVEGLAEGPVARWLLDDLQPDAVVPDSVGDADGVLIGGAATTDRNGREGGALNLDGDDHVEIDHNASLDLTNDFSIAAWIQYRPQAIQDTWYTVFEKSDPERGGHSRWGIWIRDDRLWVCYETADNSRQPCGIAEDPIPADGSWHHITGVRAGNQATLWVNGEMAGEVLVDRSEISRSSFLSFIGTDTYGEAPVWLDAALDDIQIFDRALGPDEIGQLASS